MSVPRRRTRDFQAVCEVGHGVMDTAALDKVARAKLVEYVQEAEDN